DAYAGHTMRTLPAMGGKVLSLAFSRDGRWLAAGNQDSTMRVWDMSNQLPERTFFGRTREVRSVAFSPDGLRALPLSARAIQRLMASAWQSAWAVIWQRTGWSLSAAWPAALMLLRIAAH